MLDLLVLRDLLDSIFRVAYYQTCILQSLADLVGILRGYTYKVFETFQDILTIVILSMINKFVNFLLHERLVRYNVGIGNIFKILHTDFNFRGDYLSLPDARPFGIIGSFGFFF